MPEGRIRARGGATKYRTIKKNGKTFKIAVVRKKGPRGGRTIGWESGKTK